MADEARSPQPSGVGRFTVATRMKAVMTKMMEWAGGIGWAIPRAEGRWSRSVRMTAEVMRKMRSSLREIAKTTPPRTSPPAASSRT